MTQNNAKRDSISHRCQQIRRGWSISERKLRELKASIAQSRLAVAILFQQWDDPGKLGN